MDDPHLGGYSLVWYVFEYCHVFFNIILVWCLAGVEVFMIHIILECPQVDDPHLGGCSLV